MSQYQTVSDDVESNDNNNTNNNQSYQSLNNNENNQNNKPSKQKPRWVGVLTAFLFPALGGFLFGYDIGATSFVLTQLEDANHSGISWHQKIKDSSLLQGAITSSAVAGALIGTSLIFFAKIADKIGRRRELILGGILYIFGAVLQALSGSFSMANDESSGLAVLMLGRIIYGVGIGFSMHAAPSYIAEMSPATVRGMLVSLKEGGIVLGILMGYLVGYLFENISGGWRWTYGMSAILATVQVVGCYNLPPSARWLVLQGRIPEAHVALCYIMSEGMDEALQEIMQQQKTSQALQISEQADGNSRQPANQLHTSSPSSTRQQQQQHMNENRPLISNDDKANSKSDLLRLLQPRFLPAMIAGVGLVFLQQVTGQPSVLYYANTIFKDAGVESLASVLIGAFKLIATVYAILTVDKQGRKKLLFIGISLMLVALLILTGSFAHYSSEGGINAQKIVILGAMFLYIGGYQVGFGPMSWLIISEIFPLEVRGAAVAVAVQVNFLSNLIVTFLFAEEISAIGACATFAIFAGIDVYALWFVHKHVPETKGLTLEQIEQFFADSQNRKEMSDYPPTSASAPQVV